MNKSFALAALIAMTAAMAGCSQYGQAPITKLAFGATQKAEFPKPAAGSALVAALNGGIIDRGVGETLTTEEMSAALRAEYRALEHTPAGEPVAWQADGRDFRGQVVASQPYRVGSQDCRQYRHTVVAEGLPVENRGTACRNKDGSWTPLT
ncbi:hypothetical protein [Oricola sp.]|uniref:hypothetical protein n=1 Tax=Oricola sp. TaxID=1979950 RepID=UPI003BADA088